MDSVPYDIISRIMNIVGCQLLPHEFYNLRSVSKCFRDNIDIFNRGFYHSFKNNLEIENGKYNSFIAGIKKPINLELGRKILELDNWIINDDFKYIKIQYPKYVRNHYNEWEYKLDNDFHIKFNNTDNCIEIHVLERYYNKMKELQNKFPKCDRRPQDKVVIKWLEQNGEVIN